VRERDRRSTVREKAVGREGREGSTARKERGAAVVMVDRSFYLLSSSICLFCLCLSFRVVIVLVMSGGFDG
jgi:hypothetical protein